MEGTSCSIERVASSSVTAALMVATVRRLLSWTWTTSSRYSSASCSVSLRIFSAASLASLLLLLMRVLSCSRSSPKGDFSSWNLSTKNKLEQLTFLWIEMNELIIEKYRNNIVILYSLNSIIDALYLQMCNKKSRGFNISLSTLNLIEYKESSIWMYVGINYNVVSVSFIEN